MAAAAVREVAPAGGAAWARGVIGLLVVRVLTWREPGHAGSCAVGEGTPKLCGVLAVGARRGGGNRQGVAVAGPVVMDSYSLASWAH